MILKQVFNTKHYLYKKKLFNKKKIIIHTEHNPYSILYNFFFHLKLTTNRFGSNKKYESKIYFYT